MINSIKSCFYITLLNYFYFSHCVEVHFEANDSGFFLKHTRQVPVSPEIANVHASSPATLLRSHTSYNSILSVDRFTVVQTTQPVSIRASYGPFSTKQTVPARYIVPNALDNQTDYLNNTTAALLELQQSNIHLDISAHLVSGNASPEFPVLRVLFHAGADTGAGRMQRQKICVLLHVSSITHAPLKGRCMPEGEDGVCVAEVVIPFSWFQSPISLLAKNTGGYTPLKVPQRYIQLAYSVFEPPTRNPEQCEPKVQVQPLTTFTQLPLIPLTVGFKELRPDNSFTLLLPRQPLYPMSKFHVPVYLHQTLDKAISSFSIKARVRSGIRVVSATPLNDIWNISIEKENSKHTIIRVTALKKDDTVDSSLRHNSSTYNKPINSDHNENHNHKDRIEEIFSWLFEVVGDTKDILDGGKIVWSVTYMYDTAKLKDITLESNALEDNKKKVIAKLEINKDDIQAVMPMAKNWELMNTAVLTGRQVALAMKVFIVSQGGKVAEVTLQSSCHAEDESVIKVSSSCSSVYVDGSEIRGSSNASIIVKYGTYIGLAKFIVWMPEFPLEVYISDFRLSQIKGWRVRDENHYLNKQLRRRRKRSFVSGQINTNYNGYALDKVTCRARYQQSPVEVYARFVAIDQNSGRISYFISRRTGLRVTDLVQPLLRVADPKIATLRGTILQGKTMGRTDIQVLSPITGRVIGAKEIRVGSDKVNLMKLVVRVVSGLQLTITPDNTIENGYIAETAVTHKLTAQYQEGLLDIDLQFSDGSKTPLRDVPVDDYFLLVESLDTEVVAFAPMLASHHPRVIAVGEGNGNLLRITLLLADDCRYRRTAVTNKPVKINTPPLASAMASVEVDFNTENDIINKHEIIQNDGIIGKDKSKYRSSGDLADIIGVPLRDAMHRYKATPHGKQYQYRAPTHSFDEIRFEKSVYHGNMTSMEISMYVLLTAFCFAIVVFIVSCVVYASKFKTFNMENRVESNGHPKSFTNGNGYFKDPITLEQTTTNAHDWVWLGRSTMDKSTKTNKLCPNQRFMNCKEPRIRITNNPITNCIKDINPNGPMRTARTTSFNMKNSKLLAAYIAGSYYDSQNKENISLKHCDMKLKSKDYRPPVPPHRYIGAGIFNPKHNFCHSTTNQSFKSKTDSVHSSEVICLSKKERNDQADISEKIASNQGLVKSNVNSNEKHNAEKLVEQAIDRRNVFQFDTITLQRTEEDLRNGNIETEVANRNNGKLLEETNGNCKDQLENCFMKLHNRQSPIVQHRTKRATIVGNPMFSSGIDADVMQDESLSLDDLDMDYEQIMHYFDNLKESNA